MSKRVKPETKEMREHREMVERLTEVHVHEWRLITGGPECDECQYSATIGVASCECGHILLGPSAIERRLNAVESLSAGDARSLAASIFPEVHRPSSVDWARDEMLLGYASALEGDDD